jgi:hypothetical protein
MCRHNHMQDYEEQCCGKQDENCSCGNAGGDCSCGSSFSRRYQTKEEERSYLESYLADLKLEVQAVGERLADLQK